MIFIAVLLILDLGALFANPDVSVDQVTALPACSNNPVAKTAGQRFKVSLPMGVIIKNVDDYDYRNYFVAFGKGKQRVWLSGGFGPNWSSGKPTKGWLEGLVDVNERNWVFKKRNDRGVDIKGKTIDGKHSRFFGAYGETIQYDKVPQDAALYFDRIIDSVCYQQQGY